MADDHAHPWGAQHGIKQEHLNLLITGPTGTGKSLLSAVWLHEHIMGGCSGRFIDSRALGRRLADVRKRDAALEEFAAPAYLVIDDLLAEDEDRAPASVSVLIELLNARSANNDPTCFSSNLPPTQLRGYFSERGFSRLMHRALIVPLDGADWRLL